MKSCKNLKGGLSDLADDLSVRTNRSSPRGLFSSPLTRYLASDPNIKQAAIAC